MSHEGDGDIDTVYELDCSLLINQRCETWDVRRRGIKGDGNLFVTDKAAFIRAIRAAGWHHTYGGWVCPACWSSKRKAPHP